MACIPEKMFHSVKKTQKTIGEFMTDAEINALADAGDALLSEGRELLAA